MMDFDASVFVMNGERQYTIAGEYDPETDGEAMFVVVTNDMLNQEFDDDNSICIHKDIFESVYRQWKSSPIRCLIDGENHCVGCHWQSDYRKIPKIRVLRYKQNSNEKYIENRVSRRLNGFHDCREIMNNVGRTDIRQYIPAIMFAYDMTVIFDGWVLKGYLPAIGQLLYVSKNIDLVNIALKTINPKTHLFPIKNEHAISSDWWSSTEVDYESVWGIDYGEVTSINKFRNMNILPIYRL